MESFNFTAPADVFTAVRKGSRRGPAKYRRFNTGADALRYVVEAVPPEDLAGLTVETDDGRFNAVEVRTLYDRPDYPLSRTTAKSQ